MIREKTEEAVFKNIIRQMVKVSRSAFGLTENVESLRRNIHEQSEHAASVKEENRGTLQEIIEIEDKTSSLSVKAEEADAASRKGRDKQKQYLNEVTGIADSINRGVDFLQEFRKSSEDINRLTHIILDLSGRLDVLAINGAIEAARQGKAGAGFSVIAREMKALAQETAVSAQQVEEIVGNFNRSAGDINELFRNSSEALNKSRQNAGSIYDVFLDIEKNNTTVSEESRDISTLVESLAAGNENREKSTSSILEAAGMSKVQVEQVSKQSEDLHNVVDSILETMGGIQLDWHNKALSAIKEISFVLESRKGVFTDILEKCFRDYPFIELLYVMDSSGIQVENNAVNPEFSEQIDGGGAGEDRSGRPYFRQLSTDTDSYISGIYVSTAANHLCLTISVPFFKDGLRYVLAADLNLEKFVKQN